MRVVIATIAATAVVTGVVLFAAPAPKLTICHIPPGNPANAHAITVSQNSTQIQSHISHGDCLVSGTPDPSMERPPACSSTSACVVSASS